jgi:hypothetical protein
VDAVVLGEPEPGEIRVEEDEAQVVDVAVVLPMLQEPRVVLGPLPPRFVAAALVELPHHAGEEAAGPIGPQLPLMKPFSLRRVDRKVVRRALDRRRHLPLGEIESFFVASNARVGHGASPVVRSNVAVGNGEGKTPGTGSERQKNGETER